MALFHKSSSQITIQLNKTDTTYSHVDVVRAQYIHKEGYK